MGLGSPSPCSGTGAVAAPSPWGDPLPRSVTVTEIPLHEMLGVDARTAARWPSVVGRRSFAPPDLRRLLDPDRLPWGHALPNPVSRGVWVGDGGERRRQGRSRGRARGGGAVGGQGGAPGLSGLSGVGAGSPGGLAGILTAPVGASRPDGGLAVYSTPPTTAGSGGHTSTPQDEAETETHDAFIHGLGGAVAQGGGAAWNYAEAYLGQGWLTDSPSAEPCTQPPPLSQDWGSCAPRADQATLYAFGGEPPCGWCPDLSQAAVDNAAASLLLRVLPDIVPQWWWVFDPVGATALATLSATDSGWWIAPALPDDGDEAELIRKAWAVIVQSKDAILWAASYVEGLPLYLDLLYELIEPPGYADIVLTTSAHLCGLGAVACTFVDPSQPMDVGAELVDILLPGPLGDVVGVLLGQPTALQPHRKATIHIIRGPEWDRYLQAYRQNELCGAISLAGTILHEMWHVVRDWHWADSFFTDGTACYPPFHLSNLFRLALYGQCSVAAEPACCEKEAEGAAMPFTPNSFVPCPPAETSDSSEET